MEINLPTLSGDIAALYEKGLDSSKITQLFVDLSLEQALVFSLLFLPFYLLAWLVIFKLFNFESKIRNRAVFLLVAAYFGSILFLKIEGKSQLERETIKKDVTYYMAYHFTPIVPTQKLCNSLEISKEQLMVMKRKDKNQSFSLVDDQFHLKDPEIAKFMKERIKLLRSLMLQKIQKDKSVAVLELVEETKEFGKVSKEVIKRIVDDNPTEMRYKEADERTIISSP